MQVRSTGPSGNLINWDDFYKERAGQIATGAKYGLEVDPVTGGIKGKASGASSANGGGTNSSASSNLFGNVGEIGGMFDQFADKSINRAKDWAQFQLGINRQQGEQDFGFRNREATRDFGFNTALTGQRIAGDQALENLRQSSETDRLQRSLTSQQTMQTRDFQNRTQQRAQEAALARLGFGF